ncbi:MAG: 50S ribosomal protein L13 [Thermoflexales bacterium]|nr:50S ribosomal protein L13 [Thermoflexales bacterium]MCS7324606.1 50S ribosomal protein L13 [Thermoflexales bacterium]MCX7940074.1 50S ribosomal protein L13 [Thermoflexales bacterium]MDW8053847.1 50S ribosomal protein L13 [Anaerolineae bacterium]MDW8292378.1 50S ribosomal protein L13 [Anaerolineae bacterium]
MKRIRTYSATPEEAMKSRKWYVVDAQGKTLGRLASQIARLIMGKHKPIYTPHVDCGDYVIVVNAQKIRVTGDKMTEKLYQRHSMYPGGFKAINLRDLLQRNPERVIRQAVWGMIPHGRLGRKMIKKLKVYGGPSHEHAAQKPEPLEIANA